MDWNNKEEILEYINEHPLGSRTVIDNISTELQMDEEIVFMLIRLNSEIFPKLHSSFQNNREFVLRAVKSNGCIFEYLSLEFRKDKEIALEALQHFGYLLEFASPELQKDKEVVLEAVKRSGRAIQFAHISLKKDMDIIYQIVTHDSFQYNYREFIPSKYGILKNRKMLIKHLKVFIKPAKFPFNDTIYPDFQYRIGIPYSNTS